LSDKLELALKIPQLVVDTHVTSVVVANRGWKQRYYLEMLCFRRLLLKDGTDHRPRTRKILPQLHLKQYPVDQLQVLTWNGAKLNWTDGS
jgi:hypothetical protein